MSQGRLTGGTVQKVKKKIVDTSNGNELPVKGGCLCPAIQEWLRVELLFSCNRMTYWGGSGIWIGCLFCELIRACLALQGPWVTLERLSISATLETSLSIPTKNLQGRFECARCRTWMDRSYFYSEKSSEDRQTESFCTFYRNIKFRDVHLKCKRAESLQLYIWSYFFCQPPTNPKMFSWLLAVLRMSIWERDELLHSM